MGYYTPAGTWVNDRGQDKGQPTYQPATGQWVIVDTNEIVPQPPAGGYNPANWDAGIWTGPAGQQPGYYSPGSYYGPGGPGSTQDPNNPQRWYVSDPNVSGGLQAIDAQGNIVGTYAYQAPYGEGGTGWNLNQIDPNTGGPTQVNYARESGGLFGLPPALGALVGSVLAVGSGLGAGYGLQALGAAGYIPGAAGAVGETIASPTAAGFGGSLAAATPELGEAAAGAAGGWAGSGLLTGGLGEAGLATGVEAVPGVLGAAAPVAGAAGAAGVGAGNVLGPVLGGGAPVAGAGGVLSTLGQYAPLASTLLQAGGGLAGGLIAGNAAQNAAQTQAQSAQDANALLAAIYGQQRADQLPFLQAAQGALGQIQGYPNFDASQYGYTPNAPVDPSQYGFTPTAPLSAAQNQFTLPTGQQALDQDPGYQFRLQQGMKALENSAAAKGGLLSGGFAKGAQQYGQGLASQEYQNAVNRSYLTNQTNYQRALQENQDLYSRGLTGNQLTYERAQQQNQDLYNRGLTANQLGYNRALQSYGVNLGRLQSLAGLGQSAGGLLSSAAGQYGAGAAGNITGAGAAQAAGQIGQANALTGALGQVGGAANNYLSYQLLSQLLQRRS